MNLTICGRARVFGDNVDTDQIYPGRYLELTEKADIASHCMEGAHPGFSSTIRQGDVIVAGRNFGCGSSREHAVITLKEAGIAAVVADSFARIFFRNALNLGLPCVSCVGLAGGVAEGDPLEIALDSGVVRNMRDGTGRRGEGLSAFALAILTAGGIKPLFRKRMLESR